MSERAVPTKKLYTFAPPISFGGLMTNSTYKDKLGLRDCMVQIGSKGKNEFIAVSPTPFAGPKFRELLAEIAPHPDADSSRSGIIGDLRLPMDFALDGGDEELINKHARLRQWARYLPHAEAFYRAANGDAHELTESVKESVNTKDEIVNRLLRSNLGFPFLSMYAKSDAMQAHTAQFAKDHTGMTFDGLSDAALIHSLYFRPAINPNYKAINEIPDLGKLFIHSLPPGFVEELAENHNNSMSHPGIKIKAFNGEATFAQGPYDHIPGFTFLPEDKGFKVTQGDFFEAYGNVIGEDGNKTVEYPTEKQKFSGFITPVMRWTSAGDSTNLPRYDLDIPDKSVYRELRPFIEHLVPDGMTYSGSRYNTLAGLMVATYFSPEVRERWEPVRRLPGNKKLQDMMGGQVGLSIIMDILTAVQSKFFKNAERYYSSTTLT